MKDYLHLDCFLSMRKRDRLDCTDVIYTQIQFRRYEFGVKKVEYIFKLMDTRPVSIRLVRRSIAHNLGSIQTHGTSFGLNRFSSK